MSELVSNGVQIYQFPTDDEAVSEINASMNVSRVVADDSFFSDDIGPFQHVAHTLDN